MTLAQLRARSHIKRRASWSQAHQTAKDVAFLRSLNCTQREIASTLLISRDLVAYYATSRARLIKAPPITKPCHTGYKTPKRV